MIRLHQKIDSETLYLPELKPMIGKTVEIVIREDTGPSLGQSSSLSALSEIAGKNLIDPMAYQEIRAASLI
ncbi:MAG: hypothetical protein ABSG67_10845 [Thermoguttaceae bacterium]|jgi:hypothetical protein